MHRQSRNSCEYSTDGSTLVDERRRQGAVRGKKGRGVRASGGVYIRAGVAEAVACGKVTSLDASGVSSREIGRAPLDSH